MVRTIGNDSEGSDGRSEDPYALLGWWELTQCLQQELQPEVVVAGKTFDHAVVGEDGVDVFFQGNTDWSVGRAMSAHAAPCRCSFQGTDLVELTARDCRRGASCDSQGASRL